MDENGILPTGGIQVRRVADLAAMSQVDGRPPRHRLEHAVLLAAAAEPREDAAVAVLAHACQQGRTTPRRLLAALAKHPRLRRRRLLETVLGDVAVGASGQSWSGGTCATSSGPTGCRAAPARPAARAPSSGTSATRGSG